MGLDLHWCIFYLIYIGRGTGSLVFGPIMDKLGPRWAFRICSGLAATTLVFFFIMQQILPPVKPLCDDSEKLKSADNAGKELLQNGCTENDIGEKDKMLTKGLNDKAAKNGLIKPGKDINENNIDRLSSV